MMSWRNILNPPVVILFYNEITTMYLYVIICQILCYNKLKWKDDMKFFSIPQMRKALAFTVLVRFFCEHTICFVERQLFSVFFLDKSLRHFCVTTFNEYRYIYIYIYSYWEIACNKNQQSLAVVSKSLSFFGVKLFGIYGKDSSKKRLSCARYLFPVTYPSL